MRKIHLKKRNNNLRLKKRKIHSKEKKLIIILLILFCTMFSIVLIGKKITPILMIYAEKKSKTIANTIIVQAVNNNVLKEMDKNKLFIETTDNNGNIISTNFDSIEMNKVLNEITICVENYLEELETGNIDKLKLSRSLKEKYGLKKSKKGIVYEIPSGIIFNNSLLSNLGPKIPVKINLNGDVITNVKTDVTNYGINNALIKVSINIKVYMQVIIPFKTEEIVVESDVPLVMRLIKGEVPNYYYPIEK